MTTDPNDLQRALDELAIRRLVDRYCDGVTRCHAADWGATWAEDGTWEVMGRVSKGREEIVATWKSLMDMFSFIMQTAHHGVVSLDGNRGRGRWLVSEQGRMTKGDLVILNMGMYADEYVRGDGEWLFASRNFHLIHAGPPDLSGPLHALPDDL